MLLHRRVNGSLPVPAYRVSSSSFRSSASVAVTRRTHDEVNSSSITIASGLFVARAATAHWMMRGRSAAKSYLKLVKPGAYHALPAFEKSGLASDGSAFDSIQQTSKEPPVRDSWGRSYLPCHRRWDHALAEGSCRNHCPGTDFRGRKTAHSSRCRVGRASTRTMARRSQMWATRQRKSSLCCPR